MLATAGGVAAAVLPGLAIAGLGYAFREEIAKLMLGSADGQAQTRGLSASSMPNGRPNDLAGKIGGANARPNENHVTVQAINVTIDGDGKDNAALGREIGEQAGQHIEQNWQTLALQSGVGI